MYLHKKKCIAKNIAELEKDRAYLNFIFKLS